MSPQELTRYLHDHIPLTAAMQLRVLRNDAQGVELEAPLAPNRNHRGTGFGGSLVTLGIATGWTLLQQGLRRESLPARVVVQRSECDYLEPVTEAFRSAGSVPAEEWSRFVAALRQRGRARITVNSSLHCAGREVLRHSGIFVAIAGDDA
jgi:thioesterase domain-containing protein